MKVMVRKILISMISISVLIILLCVLVIHMYKYKEEWKSSTYILFEQAEHILEMNALEQDAVIAEYRQLCMNYADSVGYILDKNPSIMDDVNELNKIAELMQLEEIHIFNEEGTIVKGNKPKYYGYTVYDGEQIGFFAQMLNDKSLRLCQDVTPNTSEAREMQYAAVWSEDGKYIIQIGISPERVLEVISKNQLSYIFSLLTSEDGTELYAVDMESGEILGSTHEKYVGEYLGDLGLDMDSFEKQETSFFGKILGVNSYCAASAFDSVVLLRTSSIQNLYGSIVVDLLVVAMCLIITSILMIYSIEHFLNKHIVQGINEINKKLTAITMGETEQVVDVCSTPEFELLSNHINYMKKSILKSTEKMSYVLDHASLPMGVYEYNTNSGTVRITNQVKSILGLTNEEALELLSDCKKFEKYIEGIKANPIEEFPNAYSLYKDGESYVKMDHFEKDEEVVGILIDVTNNVLRSRRIEHERDFDMLTGLYNRRALEAMLEELEVKHQEVKHSALIMLDADGLKDINDKYEHKVGDKYICEIARLLRNIEAPQSIISRQGGDEFVIYYYGCDSEEELLGYLAELNNIRDNAIFYVDGENEEKIRYSFGYVLCHDRKENYSELLREADFKMYEDKRIRKAAK